MSLLDQVMDPRIFEQLDKRAQELILQGVDAGAKTALSIELGERIQPELSATLSPALTRVLSEAVTRPAKLEARTLTTEFQAKFQGKLK